jgi:hypothetical protein
MAIKEVRKLAKTNKKKADYVRLLLQRNKIKLIVSDNGFVSYDTEELKQYRKSARRGRPIKARGGE